ncbi:MAG: arginine deiminase family protein [Methanomicrobiales archaeon]|nr:arginine deiminase family protein [Methanomicrobiales archaeon]
MKVRVRAEWEPLKTVVVHRPGIEMFFGLLEPFASLYERAFSRYGARREHANLEEVLRQQFDVKVLRLKDQILLAADNHPQVRRRLIDLARESLVYTGDPQKKKLAWREFEKSIPLLDVGHFFNILLLHPRIDLQGEEGTRMVHVNITEREPLSNLYFMRDQQVVTDKGMYLTRMAKPQRERETTITRFLWEIMKVSFHEIRTPGIFEGGDFIPLKDFALIGIGDRSNQEGVDQLLSGGTDFDEFGVVHQPTHPLISGEKYDPMVNMHLDTYINFASPSVVVGSELLMKRATVEIYYREGKGRYKKERSTTDLHSYMKQKGFDIIDLTTLEQMAYAPNFLCIRDGTILSVETDRVIRRMLTNLSAKADLDPIRYKALLAQVTKEYQKLLFDGQFFPHKKEIYRHGIDAYPVILENLTGGYGAAHCMTCVLQRR